MDNYPALSKALQFCIASDIPIPDDLLKEFNSLKVKSLSSRAILEAQLKKVLATKLRGQLEKLLDILGDPPDLTKLQESFWNEAGEELTKAVMPVLEKAFLAQAQELIDEIEFEGVDWNLVNTNAVNWANRYTFDLVTGINNTTRKALQDWIGSYYNESWTMGDLIDKLSTIYSPVRAEMIAVTEVTRASVQGEISIADTIRKMNPAIELTPIWQTNNDELVCDICGPFNEKPFEEWGHEYPDGPPAHVNCRCWINHEVRVNT